MSSFQEIYKKLFGAPNKAVKHQEVLVRPSSFMNDFNHWKNSYQRKDLLNTIRDSRNLKMQKIIGEPDVHLLNTPTASGIAISCQNQIASKECQYLMEWLKEQVLILDYKQANADISISEKGEYVETIEKYYLKPMITGDAPYSQQYGNVLIEFIAINNEPSYLKLIVNSYNDSSYHVAKPFEELADYLLNNKK